MLIKVYGTWKNIFFHTLIFIEAIHIFKLIEFIFKGNFGLQKN